MAGLKFRFAPSVTGFMHVGNLRTMLLCRAIADEASAAMVIRVDDNSFLSDCTEMSLFNHLMKSLKAVSVPYEAIYTWSARVPEAMQLLAKTLTAQHIKDILKHPGHAAHIGLQELLSITIDQVDEITSAVRGEDLAILVVREQWIVDHIPSFRMVCTQIVPVVTYQGAPIHKTGLGTEQETDLCVLQAVGEYGAERLKSALIASAPWPWGENQGENPTNDWDEIKRRWLE